MSNVYEELRNRDRFDDLVAKAYRDLGVTKAQSKEIDFILKELSWNLLTSDGITEEDKFDGYTVAEYMKGAMAVGLAIRQLVIDDVEVRLKPDIELTEDELVEDVN